VISRIWFMYPLPLSATYVKPNRGGPGLLAIG